MTVEVTHDSGHTASVSSNQAFALERRGYRRTDLPPPPKAAPKSDWVAHAVAAGADVTEAAELTKDELVQNYG